VEFDRSDWLFVRHTERMRRAVRECGVPVIGLSTATAPAEAAFGGLEQTGGDVVVAVSIRYGDPSGAFAVVRTSRAALPLRELIEPYVRPAATPATPATAASAATPATPASAVTPASALVWSEGDATVLLDGRPVPARIVRAGEHWWAVGCTRGDVTISVAGHRWHPALVALDTLAGIDRLLDDWRPPPPPSSPPPAVAVPAGEPHRLLVTAALEAAEDRRRGTPGGGLPAQWGALWRAAVVRQAYLADQKEPEADQAVRTLIDQLTELYGGAEWFRDDRRRRERAITESLLYATRLTDAVSSRQAQDAWPSGSRRRWLHEWAVWASSA
jgi:hypothetical protein